MTWCRPSAFLHVIVSASRLLLAALISMALALPAWAGSPESFFKEPASMPELIQMSEADIVGKTQQQITPHGLRWISYEAGGRWHAMNESNRPISGTWEIDDGRACLSGGGWYAKRNCYTFYGDAGEIIGFTSEKSPGLFAPTSFYVTADPVDGLGEVMSATKRPDGAFPSRAEKLFLLESQLKGLRITILSGSGEWFEFRPDGELRYATGGGDAETGTWEINELGDVCVKTGGFFGFFSRTVGYDLLGTKETGIIGMRSYAMPFRYYMVRAERIRQ